jgi:hypothetical protein
VVCSTLGDPTTPEDVEEPETSEEEPDEEEETFRLDSEPEEQGPRKSKQVGC